MFFVLSLTVQISQNFVNLSSILRWFFHAQYCRRWLSRSFQGTSTGINILRIFTNAGIKNSCFSNYWMQLIFILLEFHLTWFKKKSNSLSTQFNLIKRHVHGALLRMYFWILKRHFVLEFFYVFPGICILLTNFCYFMFLFFIFYFSIFYFMEKLYETHFV